MRAWLKHIYRDTDVGFRLLFPLVRLRDYVGHGHWRSDRTAIARQFASTFGRPLDWEHPRTLNEKMQWLKRYYRAPLQRVAADKYAVREHVRTRVGGDVLIPLLAVYERAADIRFEELPSAFVLKVNHGSGQNWIVRDKSKVDERRLRRQFREWMAVNHYAASREWPYHGIKPLIVAEELLMDEDGQIPSDYKLHCFGGQVACIQVDLDRDTAHRRNFYDTSWQQLPFMWTEWEGDRPLWPTGRDVPRPVLLSEMIRLAEALAVDFPYVRIDLFHCHGRLYFGEITFFHGGGFERFEPAKYDRDLGDRLVLPANN